METPEEQLRHTLERLNSRLESLEAGLAELTRRLEAVEGQARLQPAHAPPPPPLRLEPVPRPPEVAPPLRPVAPPLRPVEPPAPRVPHLPARPPHELPIQAATPVSPPAVRPPETTPPPRPPIQVPPPRVERPATAAPVPAAPPVRREPPAPAPGRHLPENWETNLLPKLAAYVGAVALILAAAYFFQLAIRNGWIGPAGQVGIGIVAGLVLLVFGDVNLRQGRRPLGEALLGAGIAVLYVSVYASYAWYQPALLGHLTAFASLAAVTAVAVAVAVRGDAQSTAILAVFGGFLTPVLLRGGGGGGGGDDLADLVQLFSYVTILDLGLLTVSVYKRWRPLQVLCFAASWLLLWAWLGDHADPLTRYYTAVPAFVLFVIFLLVPVIRNLRLRQQTQPEELGLILANPACFFPTAAALVAIYHQEYLGSMAAALAVLNLLLG